MVLAILQGFVEGQPVLTAYALLVLVPVLYSYLSKGKPQFLFMHKSKWLTDRVTDFSKAHGRSVELMATLGIVLGTGLFGLHYVLSRHKSPYNSVLFVFGAIVFASLNWWFVYSQQFGLISEFGRALSVPLMTLFGLSFFLVVALGDYSFTVVQGILEAKKTCPTVAPVLPGVSLPGFGVSIPLIEGWIALMVAMFVHELSHGVLMQRFRSGLESVGLLAAGLLPVGAFAEPDEKKFNALDPYHRFKILAAGAAANFAVFALVAVLLFALGLYLQPFSESLENAAVTKAIVTGITEREGLCGEGALSAAAALRVRPGWELVSVNGNSITSRASISSYTGPEHAGQSVLVVFRDENGVLLEEKRAMLGQFGTLGLQLNLETEKVEPPLYYNEVALAIRVLFWMGLLNLLLSLFNFLSIGPTDGGRLQPELMGYYLARFFNGDRKKAQHFFYKNMSVLVLVLIVFNALPWLLNAFR